jgi:CRISPR system Cascade subunit CasE
MDKINVLSMVKMIIDCNERWFENDLRYSTHCLLRKIFCGPALKPFEINCIDGKRITILGYTTNSIDDLKEYVKSCNSSFCSLEYFEGKRMLDDFLSGAEFLFRVRTSPTVRNSYNGKCTERDVFLSQCDKSGSDLRVDRKETYIQWLIDRNECKDSVEFTSISICKHKISRFFRRTHGENREGRVFDLPEVVFGGSLRVIDSNNFYNLLCRGIGRHREFGLGMLLLL